MKAMFDRLVVSSSVLLAGYRRDESAITALEYGIIASALAFVFIVVFARLGTPLSMIFSSVGSGL